MSEEEPLVLVVEDEPDLADLYATWLSERYEVRTAYGGHEAIEKLGNEVDVILLDRRMPDLPGDEVLEVVRDRGLECRVAMVTAVEPDFDIIAMGFDDYLVKPVSKDALRETVSSLLLRNDYDTGIQELYSLASKKALLESEKGPEDLSKNEEYQTLSERISRLREDLDSTLQDLDASSDVTTLYRELGRGVDGNGE
jgi:DNA-binding response OmpR family regulator